MSFRPHRLPLALVPLMAIAGSCDDAPTGTAFFDLARARTLWARHGFADYDYTLTQNCFCGFVGRARVEVRDGAGVSATDIETGEAIPLEVLRIRTVDGAFAVIQTFLEEEGERRVDVRFHDRLGYPEIGDLDLAMVADEELHFEIENLEAAD